MVYDNKIRVVQLQEYVHKLKTQNCEIWLKTSKQNIPIYNGRLKKFLYESNYLSHTICSIKTKGILFKKLIVFIEKPFNEKGLPRYEQLYKIFEYYEDPLLLLSIPEHVITQKIREDLYRFRSVLEDTSYYTYADNWGYSEVSITREAIKSLNDVTYHIKHRDYLHAMESLYRSLKNNDSNKIGEKLSPTEIVLYKIVADMFIHETHRKKVDNGLFLCGAVLGDIIGSPYEFDQGEKKKEFPLFSSASRYTDDTIMTVAVAEALLYALQTKISDSDAIKKCIVSSMQHWGRKYSRAGYGHKFRQWLHSDTPTPYGSYGNGSAMRVSSVGWLYDTIEKTREIAKLTAEVTHNHPEGIKGAEATASAIYLARTGKTKEEIKKYVEQEFRYDLSRTCDEIRPSYCHVESCQETVPEAIIAFLESNSFEDAIRNAVSLGGDTDTLAAITGSIAEAYYGVPYDLIRTAKAMLPDEITNILAFKTVDSQKNLWFSNFENIEKIIRGCGSLYVEEARYGDDIIVCIDILNTINNATDTQDGTVCYTGTEIRDAVDTMTSPGDFDALNAESKLDTYAEHHPEFLYARGSTFNEAMEELERRAHLWNTLPSDERDKLLLDFVIFENPVL